MVDRRKSYTKDQLMALHRKFAGKTNYDWSLVPNIIYNQDSIKLLCKNKDIFGNEHGEFQIKVRSIVNGAICQKCNRQNKMLSEKSRKEYFAYVRKKHSFSDGTPKYEYDESSYLGSNSKIKIYCPRHDYHFELRANMHKFGEGCKFCGYESMKNELSLSDNQLKEKINKAQEKHGITFIRNLYESTRGYSLMYCEKHGEFKQYTQSALFGKCGCKKCFVHTSNGEKELFEFIKILDSKATQNSKPIFPMEIDIYSDSKKLGFEFDGLYWHSENFRDNNYHVNKTQKAEEKGIQLIHIFEDEWLNKRNIVESRIRQLFGKQKIKIGARKCHIKQISVFQEKEFLINNHIQGYVISSVCYGLTYQEKLVALMSFGKTRKNLGGTGKYWELLRFCSVCDTVVQGAASKLFKHFLKQFKPNKVISYADRRWSINSENNLYKKLGFTFVGTSKPNYFYISENNERLNRFNFRKDILVSKYGCKPEMTEKQFMRDIFGYPRIYDCGTLKYEYL